MFISGTQFVREFLPIFKGAIVSASRFPTRQRNRLLSEQSSTCILHSRTEREWQLKLMRTAQMLRRISHTHCSAMR